MYATFASIAKRRRRLGGGVFTFLPGADSGRSKSDASVGVRGENKTGVSTRVVEKCRGDGGGATSLLPFAL